MSCTAASPASRRHRWELAQWAGRTPARATTRHTSPDSSPCSQTTLPPHASFIYRFSRLSGSAQVGDGPQRTLQAVCDCLWLSEADGLRAG